MALENVTLQEKGRCHIAKRDICKGEILFVEKPYGVIPFNNMNTKYFVCTHCMNVISSKKSSTKITCENECSPHILYCSDDCKQNDWNIFHQYECSFLHNIFAVEQEQVYSSESMLNSHIRLIMRILTLRFHEIANNTFYGDTHSFHDAWKLCSNYDKFTEEKKNKLVKSTEIVTEYVLKQLISHMTGNGLVPTFLPDSKDTEKIISMNLWTNSSLIIDILSNDSVVKGTQQLLAKIYILFCIVETNCYWLSTYMVDGFTQPHIYYGAALYVDASLFNHSCTPNVSRFYIQENRQNTTFKAGECVWFANRSLSKGEEACCSYEPLKAELYMTDDLSNANDLIRSQDKRKGILEELYFFNCACSRCASESQGERDPHLMTLVKDFKCTKAGCKGWLIPALNEHELACEACELSLI